MKTFKTLNELLNYIPHCIVCGKVMSCRIKGTPSAVLPSKPRWGNGLERVSIKLELKDNLLRSKNKKHSVSINVDTNEIIDGQDLINRMIIRWTHVIKSCPTCDFKIQTTYSAGTMKKQKCFPALTLSNEELKYTMKRGRSVRISKSYYDDSTLLGQRVYITVDRKPIKSLPLDFSKFQNINQLNKRLSTIMVFQ